MGKVIDAARLAHDWKTISEFRHFINGSRERNRRPEIYTG